MFEHAWTAHRLCLHLVRTLARRSPCARDVLAQGDPLGCYGLPVRGGLARALALLAQTRTCGLRLAPPGLGVLTRDEIDLIGAICALQTGDAPAARAHMGRLAHAPASLALLAALGEVAEALEGAGFLIRPQEVEALQAAVPGPRGVRPWGCLGVDAP